MIVFYTDSSKPNIHFSEISNCSANCAINCIKPKGSCCEKYKKKGINCKRCPHILIKQAS